MFNWVLGNVWSMTIVSPHTAEGAISILTRNNKKVQTFTMF